jgi:hypothetical protein
MTTRSRITLFLVAALMAASAAAAGAITDVRFQNTGAAQSNVPVTFGQVFAVGDVKKTDVLVGTLDGAKLQLQTDVKATYADGSVRHAIISAIVPSLKAGATGTMLLNTGGTATPGAVTTVNLLADGFTASAAATIAGVKYSASADQLLKVGAKATWMAGAVANEWQVSAPLTTVAGVAHPHLQARFAIRYYSAVKKARVDVTIENAWAYEQGPANFTYDAEIIVGGKSVYSKAGLTHLHHARWRKLFWWGGDAPAVNVQSNVPYLISSRAVPNYDQSVLPSTAVLTGYGNVAVEPMGMGLSNGYMPMTGGNDGIGILPAWAAAFVVTMDARARSATLATADAAGSYSMHYRDRATDRPVSLVNHPYMTVDGQYGDTWNPNTNLMEAFPGCPAGCQSPYTHDISHQPSLAYLPYLITGDYFYLEEMQFWAMYDTFASNPNYREKAKGLLTPEQLRGQAWGLRTLAQAAALTPDADPLKSDLVGFMTNNLDWYNANYSNNASANKLGILLNGYAVAYNNGTALAPWMDDFFTSAIGHAVDLGFDNAKPLLAWKAKFPVGRMTAPGVCWTQGAPYALTIRTTPDTPVFDTLLQGYTYDAGTNPYLSLGCNSVAMMTALGRKLGDMGGVSDGYLGYPSNMQPALAYAVDAGVANAQKAWDLFMSRTIKPNYSLGVQFNIVPRNYTAAVVTQPIDTAPPVVIAPVAPAAPSAPVNVQPTVPGTWAKIGVENAVVTVPADTFVRYGAPGAYVYAKVSGTFTASNEFFGRDPAVTVIKTVEAFTPAAAKPGKVTTPQNIKLQKLTGLTVTLVDPVTLDEAKEFTGVTATSKGVLTFSDASLTPGTVYIVRVADGGGKVLDVMYPITSN